MIQTYKSELSQYTLTSIISWFWFVDTMIFDFRTRPNDVTVKRTFSYLIRITEAIYFNFSILSDI